jgi:hypothetical protein
MSQLSQRTCEATEAEWSAKKCWSDEGLRGLAAVARTVPKVGRVTTSHMSPSACMPVTDLGSVFLQLMTPTDEDVLLRHKTMQIVEKAAQNALESCDNLTVRPHGSFVCFMYGSDSALDLSLEGFRVRNKPPRRRDGDRDRDRDRSMDTHKDPLVRRKLVLPSLAALYHYRLLPASV